MRSAEWVLDTGAYSPVSLYNSQSGRGGCEYNPEFRSATKDAPMAWEDFTFAGRKAVSGDKPIDELALALKRIAAHYEHAFSRLPTVFELLHALRVVLSAQAGSYVSGGINFNSVFAILGDAADEDDCASIIDLDRFEGAFVDDPSPGYYVIAAKATTSTPESDVIRLRTLALEGRRLICEYQILDLSITHEAAQMLVKKVLLDGFCDHYYDALADEVVMVPVRS
jgi:hypothetical protein